MCEFLLFAGTSEGRLLAGELLKYKVQLTACAATGYGGELLPKSGRLTALTGRLDEGEMRALMTQRRFCCVCDATHPFARQASENIRAACEESGTPYLRVLRPETAQGEGVTVKNHQEAAGYLSGREGNILLTTGSQSLKIYTAIPRWEERLFIRILPAIQPIQQALDLGFSPGKIIAMQGPFSKELNLALLRQTRARFLVTKDSGEAGGLPQKLWAAKEAGAQALIIGRPLKEQGLTVDEALCYLKDRWSLERI